MCPTLLGRLQTRVVILILPAILAALLSLVTGNAEWVALVGLYLVMGAVLDAALYAPIISWQPPWLTLVLGVGEYVLLMVLALLLGFGVPFWAATVFYWFVWITAQSVRIGLLPLLFLTRLEDGGELRAVRWTVPAPLRQLPVLATPGEVLPDRLSGAWARPSMMGRVPLPPPSEAGEVPADIRELVRRAEPPSA
ncbi:MAG: hypothetical protein MUE51_14800 [Thermoleophilia bacterium]|jgi:hypothetical protein|nr:hypothetical protein [Thermoleophilia bacterium]